MPSLEIFRPRLPRDPFSSIDPAGPWRIPASLPPSPPQVILVLGEPQPADLLPLLTSPRLSSSLLLIATHAPAALALPALPPSAAGPVVRVLHLSTPLNAHDAGGLRIVSLFERAQRVARFWRHSVSSGVGLASQRIIQLAEHAQTGGEFTIVEPYPFASNASRGDANMVLQDGTRLSQLYSSSATSRPGSRLSTISMSRSITPSLYSPSPTKVKNSQALSQLMKDTSFFLPDQSNTRIFDAVVNFLPRGLQEKTLLKNAILVTTLSAQYLALPQNAAPLDEFDDDDAEALDDEEEAAPQQPQHRYHYQRASSFSRPTSPISARPPIPPLMTGLSASPPSPSSPSPDAPRRQRFSGFGFRFGSFSGSSSSSKSASSNSSASSTANSSTANSSEVSRATTPGTTPPTSPCPSPGPNSAFEGAFGDTTGKDKDKKRGVRNRLSAFILARAPPPPAAAAGSPGSASTEPASRASLSRSFSRAPSRYSTSPPQARKRAAPRPRNSHLIHVLPIGWDAPPLSLPPVAFRTGSHKGKGKENVYTSRPSSSRRASRIGMEGEKPVLVQRIEQFLLSFAYPLGGLQDPGRSSPSSRSGSGSGQRPMSAYDLSGRAHSSMSMSHSAPAGNLSSSRGQGQGQERGQLATLEEAQKRRPVPYLLAPGVFPALVVGAPSRSASQDDEEGDESHVTQQARPRKPLTIGESVLLGALDFVPENAGNAHAVGAGRAWVGRGDVVLLGAGGPHTGRMSYASASGRGVDLEEDEEDVEVERQQQHEYARQERSSSSSSSGWASGSGSNSNSNSNSWVPALGAPMVITLTSPTVGSGSPSPPMHGSSSSPPPSTQGNTPKTPRAIYVAGGKAARVPVPDVNTPPSSASPARNAGEKEKEKTRKFGSALRKMGLGILTRVGSVHAKA